jgi:hypothetical protein
LDIETAPNLAYVWGLWKQNIQIKAIAESSYVLCWAAKWHGEKEIFFDSVRDSDTKTMLAGAHELLEEADVVVHYNGKKFDIPTLNKEFLIHKLDPPSPYRQVDLLTVARSSFKFTSNKLDYVSQMLGIGSKTKHAGYQLWLDCMAGKEQAWKKMERYNKNDVVLLEKVYRRLLPWVKNHPNRVIYDDVKGCPRCGSKKFQRRGVARSLAVTYRRYQCNKCGGWFKGEKHPNHKKAKFTGLNS